MVNERCPLAMMISGFLTFGAYRGLMGPETVKRKRLDELDALRGIGALMVVIYHYSTRFHEMFPQAPHVPFNFAGGNYRVLLFFAISGFAIFFTLDRIRHVPDFLMNRFTRLFPAYWGATIMTLAAVHLGDMQSLQISTTAILANFTMLEGFIFLPEVDGAYWTLTVELGFYACMLAIWLVRRRFALEPVIVGWLALKWLLALWPDMPERAIMILVLRHIPFFVIGMLSYRVWSGERSWRQQAPYIGFALITVAALETADIAAVACLLILCFWAMVEGRLGFICARPLLWLGGISYSLYLVHQHIGFTIMVNMGAAGWNPWSGFLVALLVALMLGLLLNRYVERPATRMLSAWWKRRTAVSAPPAITPMGTSEA